MATHSSILAWKIPWAEEPGGLQSVGPQRVGYSEHTSPANDAVTEVVEHLFMCLSIICIFFGEKSLCLFLIGLSFIIEL